MSNALPHNINTPCLPTCPAHGNPLTREHASDCAWRPMSAFADELARLGVAGQVLSAVDRARAERDVKGPVKRGQ